MTLPKHPLNPTIFLKTLCSNKPFPIFRYHFNCSFIIKFLSKLMCPLCCTFYNWDIACRKQTLWPHFMDKIHPPQGCRATTRIQVTFNHQVLRSWWPPGGSRRNAKRFYPKNLLCFLSMKEYWGAARTPAEIEDKELCNDC